MPSQSVSSLSQKLSGSVHKLTRKMKKPKEEIMPGELDSTEVQLARFFGKPVATVSSTTTSTAFVTPTSTASSTPTASSKVSSSSYSFSLSPTTSLVSSYQEEDVSGGSASPSTASDGTQSAQPRHRNTMAQRMEKMVL